MKTFQIKHSDGRIYDTMGTLAMAQHIMSRAFGYDGSLLDLHIEEVIYE